MRLLVQEIKFPIILGFLLSSCSSDLDSHFSFLDQIEEHSDPITLKVSSENQNRHIEKIEIAGHSGVFTVDRTNQLSKKDCLTCHQGQTHFDPKNRKAHWDIKLHHARPEVMDCRTCHLKGSSSQLVLMRGKRINMSESYQVCAQCHSSQYQDWLGGAHGKRLGGWAPPRVIQTCTGCHNPHQPQWNKRVPKRDQTIKERLIDG